MGFKGGKFLASLNGAQFEVFRGNRGMHLIGGVLFAIGLPMVCTVRSFSRTTNWLCEAFGKLPGD